MTQIKQLYANGDSFVFGMEAIEDGSRDPANKDFSFAKHVAQAFDLDYINNAYNAATNEFIFRRTILDLEGLLKVSDATDTFVIVGWTSLFREEIIAKQMFEYFLKQDANLSIHPDDQEYHDFGTLFINPNQSHDVEIRKNHYLKRFNLSQNITEFCTMYLWDEYFQGQKIQAQIIALHNYLKIKGFRHLFVNCCSTICDQIQIPVDSSVIFNWNESFYSWGIKKYPDLIREKNHFHHSVHNEYAKLVVQHITHKQLIS